MRQNRFKRKKFSILWTFLKNIKITNIEVILIHFYKLSEINI